MCKKYKTRLKGKSWEKGRETLCFRRKQRNTVMIPRLRPLTLAILVE